MSWSFALVAFLPLLMGGSTLSQRAETNGSSAHDFESLHLTALQHLARDPPAWTLGYWLRRPASVFTWMSCTVNSQGKQALESQICSLFGGRIAEGMTLGKPGVTTGASNNIQRATQIAPMTKWGLSERLGPLQYDDDSIGDPAGEH